MIFSPLDLVFSNKFSRKKLESRVGSIFTFSSRFAKKKLESKNTPKKVESSPTTHVTETRFLHVLDPPDHFGTIYIFDDFFTFGLSFFFQQIFPKKVRVQSYQHIHIQQQIRQKKLESKNTPKKVKSPAPQPTSQKPVFSTF